MKSVGIEIREGASTRRVLVIAPSIERALELAGADEPGRVVRLLWAEPKRAATLEDNAGTKAA